jgi:dsRNA-specific ribonuclease
VLASAFEAVVGVLYLANGLPAVVRLVDRLLQGWGDATGARPDAVIG